MAKIVEYVIVTDETAQGLQEQVQANIDDVKGWQPHGSLVILRQSVSEARGCIYNQPMTRDGQ